MIVKYLPLLLIVILNIKSSLLLSKDLQYIIENVRKTRSTSLIIDSITDLTKEHLVEIGGLLKDMTYVTTMKLIKIRLEEDLALGIRYIVEHSNIKYLTLMKNKLDLSREAFQLLKNTSFLNKLEMLDLSYNSFVEAELQDFLRYLIGSKISDLRLKHCFIKETSANYLANTLKHTNIRRINLDENYIKHDGAERLIKEFVKFNMDFSIRYNDLDNTGELIVNALKGTANPILNVSNYNIFLPSSVKIAAALKHSNFTTLDLSSNYLDDLAAFVIVGTLRFTQITSINLSNNHITNVGCRLMRELLLNPDPNSLTLTDDFFIGFEGSLFRNIFNILEIHKLNIRFVKPFEGDQTAKILSHRLTGSGVSHLIFTGVVNLSTSDAKSLKRVLINPTITSFEVLDGKVDAEAAEVIYKFLPETNIKFLKMKLNYPTAVNSTYYYVWGAVVNSNDRKSNPIFHKLTKIDLSDNKNISADGFKDIAKIVERLHITSLKVSSSNNHPDDLYFIFDDSLKYNQVLLSLDANFNINNLNFYLNINKQSFKRAKNVVDTIQKKFWFDFTENDLKSYHSFVNTPDLWENIENIDYYKALIEKLIVKMRSMGIKH